VVKTGTNEEGCRAYHYGGDQHAREFPKYFDLRRSGSSGPNHLFSSTAFEHYAPCAARLEETLGLGKECFDEYQNNYRKHPR